MREKDFLKFATLLFIVTTPLFAQGDESPLIDSRQEQQFLSYLKAGGKGAALLNSLPELKQGELDPVPVVTGRPCILPNRSESLHSVAYDIVLGVTRRRMLFEFTLTPAVRQGAAGINLAELLKNRSVTQFWVWIASTDPQGGGTVIDYNSRSERSICD
jgi:hypothetical protein